jgi:hypothetical protein
MPRQLLSLISPSPPCGLLIRAFRTFRAYAFSIWQVTSDHVGQPRLPVLYLNILPINAKFIITIQMRLSAISLQLYEALICNIKFLDLAPV